jgi:hypothetical protein
MRPQSALSRKETFGQALVRGQETRAQQTRAWAPRPMGWRVIGTTAWQLWTDAET